MRLPRKEPKPPGTNSVKSSSTPAIDVRIDHPELFERVSALRGVLSEKSQWVKMEGGTLSMSLREDCRLAALTLPIPLLLLFAIAVANQAL